MVICPKCKGKKTKLYWEQVVFCTKCFTTSIKGEKRYVLVCPKDGHRLAPRVNYQEPTVVCVECLTEYEVPGESSPELIEEVLD